ncbi:MAG: murein hydrolase activator EnvC family protein [candidate division WOR-3 bacterium]
MRLWCRLSAGIGIVVLINCSAIWTTEPRFGRGRRIINPVPARMPAVSGHPMDAYQGKLPWPVSGTVITGFGVQQDPKYGTKTKNSGVDIRCRAGSPVKAVWTGTVSFADVFMGQGLMIILEHGGGYYTVYSRLGELRVSAGERVNAGEVLALSGDVLHFEIRIGGKAVDPMVWLEKR